MENNIIRTKKALENLIENNEALELISKNIENLVQSEDGDIWATPHQAAVVLGVLSLGYLDNDKLNELINYNYFSHDCGSIVIGQEKEDMIEFENIKENNYYLEII